MADCPKCGGEMWDNRGTKKNPKQPDFKCKDKQTCDGAIWPEKKKEEPAPATRKATPPAKEAHSAGPHIPELDGPAPAPAGQPAGTAADLANLLRLHREIASKIGPYAEALFQKPALAGESAAGAYAAMVNTVFIEACRRKIVLPGPAA